MLQIFEEKPLLLFLNKYPAKQSRLIVHFRNLCRHPVAKPQPFFRAFPAVRTYRCDHGQSSSGIFAPNVNTLIELPCNIWEIVAFPEAMIPAMI
ncbi:MULTISPECIES: hypothetical protein [Bacillus]|nr:hypothetical protein [Bacillus glycinifermentans]MBU8785228.1 hypothetical protein [Bacillus glycinifermentans]NUJ15397.1 hypothetical protein [Bacillus glycinifermentans]